MIYVSTVYFPKLIYLFMKQVRSQGQICPGKHNKAYNCFQSVCVVSRYCFHCFIKFLHHPSIFFPIAFGIMFFLIFSLYFHNQEKRLVWDFHQFPIHQQNEWNRLNRLKLVAKYPFLWNDSLLTTFIHASLSCLHLMGPGKVCK